MKTTFLSIAAAVFAFTAQAQTKNVQNATTTTVTTIKDSDGEKKLVKTENEQQVQNLEFKNADSKDLNKDLVATPTQVTATTTITAPDGTTRTVDMDRSAFYTMGGQKYQVSIDNSGYTMMNNNKKIGLLRNTGPNSYIYRTKDKTAIGHFDQNGNLVLQTYDDKTDKFTTETYVKNQ
jgi:hypothetical protein